MELSLAEIWHEMSFLARAVAIALVAMGAGSLLIGIERYLVVRAASQRSQRFAAKLHNLLDDNKLEEAIKTANSAPFKQSPLARLTAMSLHSFVEGRKKYGVTSGLELSRRTVDRGLEEVGAEVRRGMGFLASVGSTAPFIGLFGTVIGIIVAFNDIMKAGGGGIETVAGGIAEALIVTAVGLIVAIFAVLVFNYLNGRMDKIDMQLQHATGSMLDNLEASHGNAA